MAAPTRQPSASEVEFFRHNPSVAAYAAPDNSVVFNPFATLSQAERESVYRNESARIFMRQNQAARPTRENFPLTEQQQRMDYPAYPAPYDPQQSVRETVAARALAGDPSAGDVTPEQQRFTEELKFRMLK
jgi:hypothetical protein